jgi:hypothetical protein
MQRIAIAFNLRIGAEKKLVKYIEAPSGSGGGLVTEIRGMFNRADLAMAGAIQQFNAAEERIGVNSDVPPDAPPSATKAPSFVATYPETGDRLQDFVNWRSKIDQLLAAADDARAKYLGSGDFTAGQTNLAMRDHLSTDAFVYENIVKVQPPRALPEPVRLELKEAQQLFAIGFNQFVSADKLELAELQRRANSGNDSGRPVSMTIQSLINKGDVSIAKANVKISAIAKKLGIE